MKRICLILTGLFLVVSTVLSAQPFQVTGTVSEQGSGMPLSFVNVQVKGTTTGATTADNGSYSINANPNATLVFSFIGYKTIEVKVENRKVVNVVMEPDALALDEVVMVAYGTAKKSSVTGAINSVNSATIEKRPVTTALAALSGTSPGVQVNTSFGQPGDDPSIRIRGIGSVNYSSSPLIVLDGSPFVGSMSNINPSDIESMNILKDAASTALYGSRGSNGVIMITTKKGKKDKLNVAINLSQGFSTRGLPEYDRIDAFQYYPIMWESLRNSLITSTRPIDQASILASGGTSNGIVSSLGYNPFKGIANDQVVDVNGKLNPNANTLLWGDDTDWYGPVEHIGSRTEANIIANGGNDISDYYVSVGYIKDNGWLKKTNYERLSARANVNFKPVKWFSYGINLNASTNKSTQANLESSTGYANPIYFARTMGPIYPVYKHDRVTGDYILDNNGEKVWDLGASVIQNGVTYGARVQNNGRHGIAEHMLNNILFDRNTIQSRVYAEFHFLKDFTFRVTNSLDVNQYLESRYENTIVGDGAPQGRSRRESTLRYTWNNTQILSYNKSFGRHEITAMAGHENYSNQYKELYAFRQGIIVPGNDELINFTTTNDVYSFLDVHKVEGFLSRATYSFDNGRFTAEGSYRRDGSSKFFKNVRWGNFWSIGAGWRIDREKFMKSVSWVDFLKFRASYGLNGNDGGISYYAWQVLYSYYNNGPEPGFIQSTKPGNPDLTWETTIQADLGLEFSIFNNRVRGTIDWFNKESRDLIFSLPLAPSTGYVNQDRNVGSLYNRGFEIDLNFKLYESKYITAGLNANATLIKNKITRLPEQNRIDGIVDGNFKRMEGGSVYDYWLRQWYGVDPTNGDALYLFDDRKDANGNYIITWADADCKIINDVRVTNNQNKAKYDWAGTALPEVYGSITPFFNIYGFDVSIQFNYSLGGKSYDAAWAGLMSTGGMGVAKASEIMDRWTTPGQITNVPRMDNAKTTAFNAASSRWLVKSDYLALRNISVGYNFKPTFLKMMKIKGLKVFATAENLALFSARKGLNPMQNFDGTVNNSLGFNRTVTLGLNLNF